MTRVLVLAALLAGCGHRASVGAADARGAAADGPISDVSPVDTRPVVPPTCTNGACVCSDGDRPCTGGCCAADIDAVELAGVSARDVRMAYGPDGTAYLLVSETPTDVAGPYVLELFSRAPGGAIVSTGWTVQGPGDGAFDLAVRSDGTVFVAYSLPGTNTTGPFELVTWKDGVASDPVRMGTGAPYEPALSATLDGDETLWVTWSTGYGMGGYSLDTTGTQRTWSFHATGDVEETDVEYSVTAHTVFSFYVGLQADDTEATGVNVVAGTGTLAMPCPARSAAFDSAGHLWGVYESELCRDGEISHLADTLDHPRLAVDGQGVAYTASYDPQAYVASWFASADNHGWTKGTLPTHYGVPQDWNRPGYARTALARDPQGHMSIVVAPEDAGMGALVLATFR